jgi:hypothetical protein
LGEGIARTGSYAWAGPSQFEEEGEYAKQVPRGKSLHETAEPSSQGGVEQVRTAILDSNDRITEHIKWNAPSQPSARGRDDGHSRATDHAAVAESLLELEETG